MISDERKLENERNQSMRLSCIDMATRVVGKPVYLANNVKQHDDVVKVAAKIYKFVKDE